MPEDRVRCPSCDHECDPAHASCAHCGAALGKDARAAGDSPDPAGDETRGPRRRASAPASLPSPAPAPAPPSASAARRASRSRFEPGERIDGRYRIIALVGRGGMGEIYKADDVKLGQIVALKFLPRDVESDPALLDRLLAEVRLARQVAHPNVCRVFDVGEVNGHHFITMEYVDGEDLASLLRRIGRLSEDKAAQVARQICAGLAAAHDQGILHRDLKPANIMLDGRGRARITDFGLAAVADQIGDEDLGSGTPAYMAPEQHEKREVTARSDIYALGLVLFEIFTGRRAVDDASIDRALRSGSAPTPSRPADWTAGLPPEIDAVIQRCLEIDPARRPSSALLVAAALPGGDALAAALAAGDTPSPDMVADAGAQAGLAPRPAVALLACLLALLAAQPWLSDRAALPSFPQRPKAPAILADRAGELATRLGLDDGTRWSQGWYAWLPGLSRRQGADGRPAGPSPLAYAWRKAPAGTLPRGVAGSTWVDPPMEVPGSARMLMDSQGVVLALHATPPLPDDVRPPRDPAPDGVDWQAALADLGHGAFDLRPASPAGPPPVFADERRAFEGTWPGAQDIPVRVDAAAADGTIVWLDTAIGGRRPGADMVSYWSTGAGRKLSIPRLVMYLLLPAVAGVFAWRNHRLRRVDHRGAGLALAIVFVAQATYSITRDPLYNSAREWNTILEAVKSGLLMGVEAWLFYLALEPHVRRTWPRLLIGWSRFASRRLRDPLVGQEILVGIVLGLAAACSRAATPLAGEILGLPGNLPARLLGTFPGDAGLRKTLGDACLGLSSGFVWALMILFVAAATRLIVGRAWPLVTIALLTTLIVSLESGMGRGGVVAFVEAGIRSGIALLALSRLGLLACIAAIASYAMLTSVQPTLDTDLWFFAPRIVLLPMLAAVGAWAFVAALGGRRLIPDMPAR